MLDALYETADAFKSIAVVMIQPLARAHLLHLFRVRQLPLSSPLRSLGAGLGVKAVIPPPERAGVIADEFLMVGIVVIGARPERQEVVEAPRELISRMRIDCLEETKHDPEIHG